MLSTSTSRPHRGDGNRSPCLSNGTAIGPVGSGPAAYDFLPAVLLGQDSSGQSGGDRSRFGGSFQFMASFARCR